MTSTLIIDSTATIFGCFDSLNGWKWYDITREVGRVFWAAISGTSNQITCAIVIDAVVVAMSFYSGGKFVGFLDTYNTDVLIIFGELSVFFCTYLEGVKASDVTGF